METVAIVQENRDLGLCVYMHYTVRYLLHEETLFGFGFQTTFTSPYKENIQTFPFLF